MLASGECAWEDVGESWQMASALGANGIPNRVDNWGPQWAHDRHTWRRMLPPVLGRADLTCAVTDAGRQTRTGSENVHDVERLPCLLQIGWRLVM
jgi:hypothetical protein